MLKFLKILIKTHLVTYSVVAFACLIALFVFWQIPTDIDWTAILLIIRVIEAAIFLLSMVISIPNE